MHDRPVVVPDAVIQPLQACARGRVVSPKRRPRKDLDAVNRSTKLERVFDAVRSIRKTSEGSCDRRVASSALLMRICRDLHVAKSRSGFRYARYYGMNWRISAGRLSRSMVMMARRYCRPRTNGDRGASAGGLTLQYYSPRSASSPPSSSLTGFPHATAALRRCQISNRSPSS